MNPETPALLTPKDIAQVIGFHPVTVRIMLASGDFGPYVRVGRRLLLEPRELESWIERHRVPVASARANSALPVPKPEYVALLRGGKGSK